MRFPWPHLLMFFGMFFISFMIMPLIMIDKYADWYPSRNQTYAAVVMASTMVILEGFMHPMPSWAWFVTLAILAGSVFAIRKQLFIDDQEYLHDMIPHHSMAVLTSKKQFLKTQNPQVYSIVQKILQSQQEEIETMKGILRGRAA